MSRIAVIGGHGKVALHLTRLLAEQGHQVSSVFRNPAHIDDVAATGAEPVVADVETLSTAEIADLIKGHHGLVWSAGAGGGNPDRTYAVDRDAANRAIDAAEAAGVKRFVMVSYFGAGPHHGVPADNSFYAYAEAKAAADEHLRETGLDWTILGPSRLTDDPPTGCIEVGAAAAASSPEKGHVSRADVAAVAAAVLHVPATYRHTIEFNNGPTPISQALGVAGA